jgi:flagellar hook-associated protein 2
LAISFGSIQTGLPKDIVKQLMEAERIPIKNLEKKIEKHSDKKTLVGELITRTEAIRAEMNKSADLRSLTEFSVNTNEDIIGINADKRSVRPGTYQFEVTQLARKSSAFSSGFEDPNNSYVGVGFVQYTLPNGDTNDIYYFPGDSFCIFFNYDWKFEAG